jgi:hypothetical protein
MAEVFVSILKVKGSNFTNGVFLVNNGKLIEYFLMWFPIIGAYLGWLHAYVLRLGSKPSIGSERFDNL